MEQANAPKVKDSPKKDSDAGGSASKKGKGKKSPEEKPKGNYVDEQGRVRDEHGRYVKTKE
jgi:hypothetical protein